MRKRRQRKLKYTNLQLFLAAAKSCNYVEMGTHLTDTDSSVSKQRILQLLIQHDIKDRVQEILAQNRAKRAQNKISSGVYCLFFADNTQTTKRYVGSSKNIDQRFIIHKSQLRRGVHYNTALQADADRIGLDKLMCITVQFCGPDELLDKEQTIMEETGADGLYNVDRALAQKNSKTKTD